MRALRRPAGRRSRLAALVVAVLVTMTLALPAGASAASGEPQLGLTFKVDDADAVYNYPDFRFTFKITLQNSGASSAHDVVVRDIVPAGVIVDASTLPAEAVLTGESSAAGGGVITWRPATAVAPGPMNAVTLSFRAQFAAPAYLNGNTQNGYGTSMYSVATVLSYALTPGGEAVVPTRVTADAEVKPLFPAVTPSAAVIGRDTVTRGESVRWRLSILNHGAGLAQTIRVENALPVGWALDASVPPQVVVGDGPATAQQPSIGQVNGHEVLTWAFDPSTGPALFGDAQEPRESRRTITIEFSARAVAPVPEGMQQNVASTVVTDATGATGNASGSYARETALSHVYIQADAALGVSQAGGPFTVGAPGTLRFAVRNDGPDAAPGPVTVTTTLPPGLTVVDAPGAAVNGATLTWTLATGLANGEERTLSATVHVAEQAYPQVVSSVTARHGGGDHGQAASTSDFVVAAADTIPPNPDPDGSDTEPDDTAPGTAADGTAATGTALATTGPEPATAGVLLAVALLLSSAMLLGVRRTRAGH